ncbi:hypothetical protein K875_02520 [Mycobacterium [tuberculosis] TKK-01-0051]|uniref:ATP-grasp domain-containing protein n=1 Tax=Mycobacterium [tuberculosis] TKK-01-0051 TaxID=1324261 RepID=A0A051U4C8_9MYCO|nr:hypothetical protein K875_02520 [Mycobacterium [tuberculosis] TKK-01-0051]
MSRKSSGRFALPDKSVRVLVAGIAGASLGTEVAKALDHAGGYDVLGCDISPLAFGHYDARFSSTFVIARDGYARNLLDLCVREQVDCVIPGGDEPAVLIGRDHDLFARAGIRLGQNNPQLTERLAHKGHCFEILESAGVRTPRTLTVEPGNDVGDFPMPCIVKPAVASGGSVFVFFVRSREEAQLYCTYLHNNGRTPVIQEYLPEDRGEFTVGVLSLPDGSCAGAIALKRAFHSKLSVAMRGSDFLISSGYSQGLIEAYPAVCEIAKLIAQRLGSTGPLNIQGRIASDGTFVPFEINARFSASTYLRTLAGFNEVDWYVRQLLGLAPRSTLGITPGWYLRSLSEVAVPLSKVSQ